jgi:adenylyltransferase/sulfurtransferase
MDSIESKYKSYFARQIELWGEEKQNLLKEKKIAIIGCGGLGSSLAMALGTSGIGAVHLVDFDMVSLHNIHRQIAFSTEDVEHPKARVVAALIRRKNPFVNVTSFEMDFDTFSQLDNYYDLILDATDNFETRRQIDEWTQISHIPWIYGSVEEFNGQVCFFERSSFSQMNTTEHHPAGIAAPMAMHIASLQANMALRYLVGLPIAKDKLHYLYFDAEGELMTQKIGMSIQ